MEVEYKSLKDYEENVFNKLDDKTRLAWMYQMSKTLCETEKYVIELEEIISKIKEVLGDAL